MFTWTILRRREWDSALALVYFDFWQSRKKIFRLAISQRGDEYKTRNRNIGSQSFEFMLAYAVNSSFADSTSFTYTAKQGPSTVLRRNVRVQIPTNNTAEKISSNKMQERVCCWHHLTVFRTVPFSPYHDCVQITAKQKRENPSVKKKPKSTKESSAITTSGLWDNTKTKLMNIFVWIMETKRSTKKEDDR